MEAHKHERSLCLVDLHLQDEEEEEDDDDDDVVLVTKEEFQCSHITNVLHLPFIDETHNLLKHQFFQKSGNQNFEDNLKHNRHQHPLHLVHTQSTSSRSDLLLSCHDPMKKTELLCNGCLRPITSKPFYKCVNESCNFVIHEWCTRLPTTIQHYKGHHQHTLTLHPSAPNKFFSVFVCAVCKLSCNGFVYSCVQCDYQIDVNCAFIPTEIKHAAHRHNLVQYDQAFRSCRLCLNESNGCGIAFHCVHCRVFLHVKCAFLLSSKIRHKYDKHPLILSYRPIKNHKSDYFCEICEDELNPQRCFYHCSKSQCNQSIHSSCAPFILESETPASSNHDVGVYEYVNIKFGDILIIKGHPHSLNFVQGIDKDGHCTECDCKLQNKMIFKCLQCKFAIDLECCERLSSG